MKERVPVNPDILRWARETLGIPLEQVARRMGKPLAVIEAWEGGEDAPTYAQLESLAYDLYRRPVALFFFPEVPVEDPPEGSLPGEVVESLPSRIRWLIRRATVLRMNIMELRGFETRPTRNIVRDLDFSRSRNEEETAQRVRDYLGRSLSEQQSWKEPGAAFEQWRTCLEDAGVSVFRDSLSVLGGKTGSGHDSGIYAGFCLYDDDCPLICVNDDDAEPNQVFTLFHELAHLLRRTGAVDLRGDRYSDALSGGDPSLEARCDQFAAAFLVPADDLSARSRRLLPDEDAVTEWARLYGVSRQTILRRLRDCGRLSAHDYDRLAKRGAGTPLRRSRRKDDCSTRGACLGERYVGLVFEQYHRDRISMREAAEYLRVGVSQVDEMEEWLFERGEDGPSGAGRIPVAARHGSPGLRSPSREDGSRGQAPANRGTG